MSDLFLNFCTLTDSVSEIVELSTSDLTASYNVDFCNVGRVEREGLFYAAAVCNSAYRKGLRDTAAVLADNRALKKLDSFTSTLFDEVVYSYGITDIERGDFRL